ncbi:MAG: hypothetical protein WA261_11125 [Candidatus Sulfotelmatobacter sp.]|jgi:hypothetical protein
MMPTLILRSPGYFVAFLVLVSLMFAVDRLGLMLSAAWLSHRENKREHKLEGNGSGEYWRVHR